LAAAIKKKVQDWNIAFLNAYMGLALISCHVDRLFWLFDSISMFIHHDSTTPVNCHPRALETQAYMSYVI
jgi:hypothetical protein